MTRTARKLPWAPVPAAHLLRPRQRAAPACIRSTINADGDQLRQLGREYDLLMNHAAIWDVGERQVQLEGPDELKLAQLMSLRDVSKCKIGQGFYTPILSRDGGVINDPILLKLSEDKSGCRSRTATSSSTPWGWPTPWSWTWS